MSKILADVHMAEGALLNISYARKDSMRAVYYEQIYEIYEVEEATFRHDMEYYQEHPDAFEDLYDLVIKHLAEIDAKIEKGKD